MAAVPQTIVAFVNPHIKFLLNIFEITVVCGSINSILVDNVIQGVNYKNISISRKIHLFNDFFSLIKTIIFFKKNKFDIVHSITPKAGLITMVSAWICGIPIRVHIFTGQVWVNKTGFSRALLKFFDQITSLASTHILADSKSQKSYLIEQGIVNPHKISVLGFGSVCGVDIDKFRPNELARKELRIHHGIDPDTVVALYIGRITRDKGVFDLAKAFIEVADSVRNLHLLFVGSDEDYLLDQLYSMNHMAGNRMHFIPHTDKPEQYMATADFLCLPSYREGFGSVIIEAAAVGLPAIASNIYGIEDAIVDGQTGFLHDVGSSKQIASFLTRYTMESDTRLKMGEIARKRAINLFSSTRLIEAQMHFYQSALQSLSRT